MELYKSKYWVYTIFLQKFVGIWPFQDNWKCWISWIYLYSFTSSFIISMAIRMYEEFNVNMDIVVENTFGILYLSIIYFKISTSIICRNKLQKLLLEIADDWKVKLKNKDELKIMHMYAEYGRRNIIFYSSYLITAAIIFLALPITSPILDWIIPLENGTLRPRELPYYAEYGISIEDHYYPMVAQACFGGVGTIVVLVSFDLNFILIVQHVIGLFAIVNFRMRKAAKLSKSIEQRRIKFKKADHLAYLHIVEAIELHKTAIKYIHFIEDTFSLSWLIIYFLNMVMLGFGLATALKKLNQPMEFVRYISIICITPIHIYNAFLPGQKIIDSSEEVFIASYSCKWYNLSEKTKTLVKIIMMRSLKRCALTGGKMFVISMETYCNMIKTGFSVFAVINTSNKERA